MLDCYYLMYVLNLLNFMQTIWNRTHTHRILFRFYIFALIILAHPICYCQLLCSYFYIRINTCKWKWIWLHFVNGSNGNESQKSSDYIITALQKHTQKTIYMPRWYIFFLYFSMTHSVSIIEFSIPFDMSFLWMNLKIKMHSFSMQ